MDQPFGIQTGSYYPYKWVVTTRISGAVRRLCPPAFRLPEVKCLTLDSDLLDGWERPRQIGGASVLDASFYRCNVEPVVVS